MGFYWSKSPIVFFLRINSQESLNIYQKVFISIKLKCIKKRISFICDASIWNNKFSKPIFTSFSLFVVIFVVCLFSVTRSGEIIQGGTAKERCTYPAVSKVIVKKSISPCYLIISVCLHHFWTSKAHTSNLQCFLNITLIRKDNFMMHYRHYWGRYSQNILSKY